MKRITINLGGVLNDSITLELSGGGGVVTSTLKTECEDEGDLEYNAAIDGVEALILSHAVAGVDVESVEYKEGLVGALQAIADQF
jgi:hypothetical protein